MESLANHICDECNGAGEVWVSPEEDKTECRPCNSCGGRGLERAKIAAQIDHRQSMQLAVLALRKYFKAVRNG